MFGIPHCFYLLIPEVYAHLPKKHNLGNRYGHLTIFMLLPG